MKLYLVRHGETDWNARRLVQGREDVPLNDRGRAQARATAQALRLFGAAQVACSPLSRASETAAILAETLGIAEIRTEDGLIERDYGPLSRQAYPDGEDLYTFTERHPAGMETLDQVAARAMPVLERYSRTERDTILVSHLVSHGGTINILLWKMTGGELGYGVTKLKNACICVLETDETGRIQVRHCNLTAAELAAVRCAAE